MRKKKEPKHLCKRCKKPILYKDEFVFKKRGICKACVNDIKLDLFVGNENYF